MYFTDLRKRTEISRNLCTILSFVTTLCMGIHSFELNYNTATFISSKEGQKKCIDDKSTTNVICFTGHMCDSEPSYAYLPNGKRLSCEVFEEENNPNLPKWKPGEAVAPKVDFLRASCYSLQNDKAALVLQWGYEVQYLQDSQGFYIRVEELPHDYLPSEYYAKLIVENVEIPDTASKVGDCLSFTFNCHGYKSPTVYHGDKNKLIIQAVPTSGVRQTSNAVKMKMKNWNESHCAERLEPSIKQTTMPAMSTDLRDGDEDLINRRSYTTDLQQKIRFESASSRRISRSACTSDGLPTIAIVLIVTSVILIVIFAPAAYLRKLRQRNEIVHSKPDVIHTLLMIAGECDYTEAYKLATNLSIQGYEVLANCEHRNEISTSPMQWYYDAVGKADAVVIINTKKGRGNARNNNLESSSDESRCYIRYYIQSTAFKTKWTIFLNDDMGEGTGFDIDEGSYKIYKFQSDFQQGDDFREFLEKHHNPSNGNSAGSCLQQRISNC